MFIQTCVKNIRQCVQCALALTNIKNLFVEHFSTNKHFCVNLISNIDIVCNERYFGCIFNCLLIVVKYSFFCSFYVGNFPQNYCLLSVISSLLTCVNHVLGFICYFQIQFLEDLIMYILQNACYLWKTQVLLKFPKMWIVSTKSYLICP